MEQQDKIDQLVAENQELLALTKRAFVKREVEKESVPVDEEWEKFAAEHADELDALEKDEPRTATITRLMGILPYKVAASIIGILFTAGVAFAAIHIASHYNAPKEQETKVIKNSQPSTSSPQLAEPDTIVAPQPKLYDNVPLGEIFEELSGYYNVKVVYQNEDAPRLRLFYQWKPEYTLEKVVEMLNNFEWIQIQTENDTLFIRTTAIPAKDC